MNKISIISLGVVAASLFSCSSEDDCAALEGNGTMLQISVSIEDEESRALNNNTSFSTNDRIGLYIIPAKGSKLTEPELITAVYNGKDWKLSKDYDLADFTSVSVMAYYPYQGVNASYNAETGNIEYAIDLTASQTDVLTSNVAVASKSNGRAELSFHHTLSCLTLNVSKGAALQSQGNVESIEVMDVRVATSEGNLLMDNGEGGFINGSSSAADYGKLKFDNVGRLSAKPVSTNVLVFPIGKTKAYKVVATVDGKAYQYVLPASAFQSGRKAVYNIVVDDVIENIPNEIYYAGCKALYLGINDADGKAIYWAERNVGAAAPTEAGEYFAWGEIKSRTNFTAENYTAKVAGNGVNISGDAKYDAARANMGSGWRLPTRTEMEQLMYRTTNAAATVDGVDGWTFTGDTELSIFLPKGGCYFGDRCFSKGEAGYYWTSNAVSSTQASALTLSWASMFMQNAWNVEQGCNVRAVISR